MGFFSRKPAIVEPQMYQVWEDNPAFGGRSFNHAMFSCRTVDELIELEESHQLNSNEYAAWANRMTKLTEQEELEAFRKQVLAEETQRVREWYAYHGFEDTSNMDRMINESVEFRVNLQRNHNLQVAAAEADMDYQYERDAKMDRNFDRVVDAIHDTDHIGKAKQLVAAHPFLAGFLGRGVIDRF